MNHRDTGCHVPAYNEFSKNKASRNEKLGGKATLEINSAQLFDKVMSAQEAVMDYQRRHLFSYLAKDLFNESECCLGLLGR